MPALAESDEQDTYRWMGFTLMSVQRAERVLGLTLQIAFHGSATMTVDSLEREEVAVRKKTLGFLLQRLKGRAMIAPEFEQTLDRFLTGRNRFVHQFCHEPSFSIDTPVTRDAGIVFMRTLADDAVTVSKVCMAAVLRWAQLVDVSTDGRFSLSPTDLPQALDDVLQIAANVDGILTRKGS